MRRMVIILIKISVIIPVFNLAKVIEKTLDSVCNQCYKNFEIIIIDDESTDNSIEIIQKYFINKDVNYKLIKQKNKGVSAARNRGIKEAKGDYIFFLDGDDYIHKDTFMEFVKEIENTNADVLYCGYSTVDSYGNIQVKVDTKIKKIMTGKEMALNMIYAREYINMITGMYKTSIIKDNNIRFDTNRKYAEDFTFTIKCLIASKRVKAIEKNLAYYVRWIGSSTHILSLRKFDSYFSHIETLKYINENYNINEYKDIIKGIEEYRIPITIMGIYSEFCKSKLFEKEINDFINNEEIIRYLKSFKINDFTISNLKYYLLSKGILYFPKVVKKYYKS